MDWKELLSGVDCPHALMAHNEDLGPPELIKITEGVHLAFGYDIANSVLLEGPEGLVVVDTLGTVEAAETVLEEFRKVCPTQPIKVIVLTHHHTDHIGGTKAFNTEGIEIWAHKGFLSEIVKLGQVAQLALKRGVRQFGASMPSPPHVNCGIGPRAHLFDPKQTSGFVMPTKFLEEPRLKVSLAGLDLELIHIPGETADQIGVWYPDKKLFICADDVYKAFPNLYAIRGTTARSVLDWANSVDTMLNLPIEHLVPCHTRPVSGRTQVTDILTAYRDGIKFVHDETVKFMNQGLHPDDIVQKVKLPEHLASHPYLIEYYGTVAWSVRHIFNFYMGWFSGDPAELSPLAPKERAENMLRLAGGQQKALDAAKMAFEKGEHQWALQLSSSITLVDENNQEARALKEKALKALAGQQISACGRNYYLTCLQEDRGLENTGQEIRVQNAAAQVINRRNK